MDIKAINNFFGDMDLLLMDLILKGYLKPDAKVLDVGCGEGRNGIYFIQHGYEYHGWDTDESKLQLLKYLSNSFSDSKATFNAYDLRESSVNEQFDFIVCSRVLHFAKSEEDFFHMWNKLLQLLTTGGILYVSMDSVIETVVGENLENGKVKFPDGKIRYALTEGIFQEIKKGFEEIEPLRTLVHHQKRAQSFLCFRKI